MIAVAAAVAVVPTVVCDLLGRRLRVLTMSRRPDLAILVTLPHCCLQSG